MAGKGGKTSTSWKPGQSGNPKGAPKRAQSWKERIEFLANMTADELGAYLEKIQLGTEFKTYGGGSEVLLKDIVIASVFASLIREPNPYLWAQLMERTEGKVKQALDMDVTTHTIVLDHNAPPRQALPDKTGPEAGPDELPESLRPVLPPPEPEPVVRPEPRPRGGGVIIRPVTQGVPVVEPGEGDAS